MKKFPKLRRDARCRAATLGTWFMRRGDAWTNGFACRLALSPVNCDNVKA